MFNLRWARAAALLAVLVATAGCGQMQGPQTDSREGLDVLLEKASVRHGEGITVESLPVGTLRNREWLHAVALVKADLEVSTKGLVVYSGLAQREGGGAELGLTGICGRGWTKDGDKIEADPCSAASPVTQIAAGQPSTVHVRLYPVTPSGQVTTGTYRITVPLNDPDGPLLDLTYRVVEHGQAELPAWSADRIPLALTFENNTAGAWSSLWIRIEDGYGRVVDERDLSAYRNDKPDLENDGVFTVEVPRSLPLTILLLRRDGDDWKPCGGGFAFITAKSKWPQTLLIDSCGVE